MKTVTVVTVGTQLGPYRIEERIGQGGMGEVFRATDTRLGRTVAIKISLVPFSERFEREARAIAALNHPQIATLYDVGSSDAGFGYLVMEYVEGPPLCRLDPHGRFLSMQSTALPFSPLKRSKPRMKRESFIET